jgi:hypothetical protein
MGFYSYTPGSPFDPLDQEWIYTSDPPESFYSELISGAQRLPNGNTLVCSGNQGKFFEVTTEGNMVWLYVNPVTYRGILTRNEPIPAGPSGLRNAVFKIRRYAPDFPGFDLHTLTPGDPLELPPGINLDTRTTHLIIIVVMGYLAVYCGAKTFT